MSSAEDEEQSDLTVDDEVESEDDEAELSSSESKDNDEFDEEEFERTQERINANDPSLTGVYFDDQNIGDERAGRLVAAFRVNTVVTNIHLQNIGISEALMSALVDAIANITSLVWLNLSGNNIGVEAARALARFLLNCSSLKSLILNNCGTGVEGVRLLAEAVPSNSTLTVLVFGDNNIGDVGVIVLAGLLPGSTTLTWLVLPGSEISDAGARELAEALLNNCSLTNLDLRRNSISDVGGRLLAKALLVNCTVTTIYLDENGISQAHVQKVDELAQINADAPNRQEALGLKIEWLINLDKDGEQLLGFDESGAKEKAVSLALDQLESFPLVDQRRRLFERLLGSPEHGEKVAESVDVVTARSLYRYATECGAAPTVLMNLLRAHESLCTCRDVKHKLYPFMLLATMSEAGMCDVMEVLTKDPTLVKSGISQIGAKNKRKRGSASG